MSLLSDCATLERGLMQIDVEARGNIAKGLVSRILRGERFPRLDTVLKMAHALAINPSWLAFGVGKMDLRPGIARALERKSQPKQAAYK